MYNYKIKIMEIKTFNECIEYIKSDAFRYYGKKNFLHVLKLWIIIPGFKYTFYMRLSSYLSGKKYLFLFYLFFRWRLWRNSIRFGIQISHKTVIGKGFYIGHFGTIVVNSNSVIGRNVNISQGFTIGRSNRGAFLGSSIIGDNVYIAPGVKIIGNIHIGDNVAIGSNAVVTKNIYANAVAVGIPAKIISDAGSIGYINNKI